MKVNKISSNAIPSTMQASTSTRHVHKDIKIKLERVVDVARVIKNENSTSTPVDNMEVTIESDNQADNFNNDVKEKYYDNNILLKRKSLENDIKYLDNKAGDSCSTVSEQMTVLQNNIKWESAIFTCVDCSEEFVEENEYYEHITMHDQDSADGCDPPPVYNPEAAISWGSLHPGDKKETLMAASPHDLVHPVSLVKAVDASDAIQKREQIPEVKIEDVNKQPSQADNETYINISKPTNCIKLNNNTKKSNEALYMTHMSIYTGEKFHSCELCHYKTTVKSSLRRHIRTHTGEKPYSCDICNYKCAQKNNLDRHKISHGKKIYSCDICNSKFAVKTYLITHMRIHTGEKPFSCDVCNYRTADKSSLYQHKKTHSSEKPYSCDKCNYKFALKSLLLKHMKTHSGVRPYSCEMCNFKCTRKSNLARHKIIHTGEKLYACDICKIKFAVKNYLLCHMRTHTGEKPYSCEMCNFKCAQKSCLDTHIRIHTGEKPFACEICNYRTAHKSSLFKHMRTHTGEKPYSCEICNYKCARKNVFNDHIKRHTGKKPFVC